MNDDNKSIKCSVENCKYNDSSTNYCTLNEIIIKCRSKKEALCNSYKKRNG